jgi:hypothetical protein
MRAVLMGIGLSVAAACSGGGGAAPDPIDPAPPALTIGGTVTGLIGASVVLQVTGGEQITVAQDGPFAFATEFAAGQAWEVSLVSAPARTFAALGNASGTIVEPVRDVTVALTPGYQVSGTVRGLEGTLVLELNQGERVTLGEPGRFTFQTLLRDGEGYDVRFVTTPGEQRCSIVGGAGTVAGADVTGVAVDCLGLRLVTGTVEGLEGGGLVLQNNGGDDVVVAADGRFTFRTKIVDGGTYDVSVLHQPASQRVTVLAGAGMVQGRDVTDVRVTCATKKWRHPSSIADTISMDGDDADSVSVASGLRGDAVVAWEYGSRIFTGERRNGAWRHPVRDVTLPHNPAGGSSFDPQAAIDFHGNTVMVWTQRDSGTDRIYKSVYRNGVWTDPATLAEHISPLGGDAARPKVAMETTGDAIIVWEQYVNGRGRIFKSEYRSGVFQNPTSADDCISPPTTHAQDVQLAIGADGHCVVVWAQSDDVNYRIFKSERRGGAWTHPASFADAISPAGTDAYAPAVAFDGLGNAIITWVQSDGTVPQVFKAELKNGLWRLPLDVTDNISPDGLAVHAASVAMSRLGDAVVVWRQDVSATASSLFKSEYRAGVWHVPDDVTDAFSVGRVVEFAVAMDSEGNTVIAYTADDGVAPAAVLKSEYRFGAWAHPTSALETISPAGGAATSPRVTIDGRDDAIVLWRQVDGVYGRAFNSELR